MLNTMGYPVFYSDIEAKKIIESDLKIRASLISIFGDTVYQNGQLNRPFLANKVFQNPELLKQLNALVHPAVRLAFEKWSTEQNNPIVFNESALLFETGIYKNFEFTVLVTAPIETRIERVMKRDQAKREDVLNRIEKQWSDEQKSELADAIIFNDDIHPLLPQLLNVIEKLKL